MLDTDHTDPQILISCSGHFWILLRICVIAWFCISVISLFSNCLNVNFPGFWLAVFFPGYVMPIKSICGSKKIFFNLKTFYVYIKKFKDSLIFYKQLFQIVLFIFNILILVTTYVKYWHFPVLSQFAMSLNILSFWVFWPLIEIEIYFLWNNTEKSLVTCIATFFVGFVYLNKKYISLCTNKPYFLLRLDFVQSNFQFVIFFPGTGNCSGYAYCVNLKQT